MNASGSIIQAAFTGISAALFIFGISFVSSQDVELKVVGFALLGSLVLLGIVGLICWRDYRKSGYSSFSKYIYMNELERRL